jgi:hypothetical protein
MSVSLGISRTNTYDFRNQNASRVSMTSGTKGFSTLRTAGLKGYAVRVAYLSKIGLATSYVWLGKIS